VLHFEQRQEVFEGKGMIVSMSRRIAADLYNAIIKIKPEWHRGDLKKGTIKVVMTSASSDGPKIAKHHTTKDQRRILAERMKDPEDELKLVIVRDMWLTGFDVPSLHTLYIDWTIKESVKAKLKVIVKRTLRQFGYPPDMQKLATETVLKQAELIAEEISSR